MSTAVLPDKLSDLLELALADLEKAEADPQCVIDMDIWREEYGDGFCAVCLAGCVMRYSLNVMPKTAFAYFEGPMDALDWVRRGYLSPALGSMRLDDSRVPDSVDVARYEDDPAAFKADMRSIVTLLREKGL